MKEMKQENFNALVASGNTLILCFYKDNHAMSTITLDSLKKVDAMHGKEFEIYIINADKEPEMIEACLVNTIPTTLSIVNTKIHKKEEGILFSNQILDLIK